MVQVQILSPINTLAHKPRTSSFHCSPLTRRRSFPSPAELRFSHSKHQTALERVAVQKLAVKYLASLPPTKSTVFPVSAPSFAPVSVSDNLAQTTPATPPTPLEVVDFPEPKSKVDIFKNTTKSDELLDLTIAALDRIYIQDFCQESSSMYDAKSESTVAVSRPNIGRELYRDELSPPSSCGSSVSSASSTPSSIPTPPSMSPEVIPEIASPSCHTTSVEYSKPGLKPVGRTQSLPVCAPHPVIEDKNSLKWFLTELLRRSRASATVVQLALHYLNQARVPVGKILAQKFKSESEVRSDKEDSPLIDPRRLLLAALMLSTKILHDHAPNNRAWSRVCGLDALDVGKCERALGQALNWELAHMFVGPVDKPLFG